MAATNPVEKLFQTLAESEDDWYDPDVSDASIQICEALETFSKEPLTDDPDHEYLRTHAKAALRKGNASVAYFRQQLAHLAVQTHIPRKDQSYKARQLKHYRWLSRGMKNETCPFSAGQSLGLPSTTRIAALVNPTSCAACGKTGANLRCPNCTFQDEAHVMEKTAYCNKKCQGDHYKSHRPICEGRTMLRRAMSLLDFIFMEMEEATYIYPLSKAYEKDSIVYLIDHSWDRAAMTGRPIFVPFPRHKAVSPDHESALLLWGQSEELTLSLFRLVRYLLRPLSKSMDLIFTQPKNVIRPTCQVSSGRALNATLYRHTVLKLTLATGEEYVVDLTAAQFGWKETLAPWVPWAGLRTARCSGDPYQPACEGLRAVIRKNPLEACQQEVRGALLQSIIEKLNAAPDTAPGCRSFSGLLRAADDVFRGAEAQIVEMVRQQVFVVVKSEYYKDAYRLWLGPPPCFNVQIAKGQQAILKDVWMSGKEYDRLSSSGENMRKIWSQRIDGKIHPKAVKAGDDKGRAACSSGA